MTDTDLRRPLDVNKIDEAISDAVAKFAPKREPKYEMPRYETPILNERQATHGDFAENARIAQAIKDVLHTAHGWANLTNIQCESLDLIATKIGRILSGNPNERDHWDDIAGYAKLSAERL